MFEIPEEQLPPGFADTVREPPAQPASPRPAATIVLLRQAEGRPEVLLMRRHRSSRFVPGAWVFPGGRVDAGDSGPALYERIRGLGSAPRPESPFWVAALRELFEETGVLLACGPDGEWVADSASDRRLHALRYALMDGALTLLDILDELDLVLETEHIVHIAHWVTPVVEPRRYDTHFFAAALPGERAVRPDPRETTESLWIRPANALARFERGALPMVFPTVRTLQSLRRFESVEHVLDSFRGTVVPRILPRLVRTERGVGIVVDEDPAGAGRRGSAG